MHFAAEEDLHFSNQAVADGDRLDIPVPVTRHELIFVVDEDELAVSRCHVQQSLLPDPAGGREASLEERFLVDMVVLWAGEGEFISVKRNGGIAILLQVVPKRRLDEAAALGLAEGTFAKSDIHIHVPAGAIPKDGPSAGIGMCTALVSALTRIPVRSDVAMTGEITLRGKVLPIGGVKEKLMAAHRMKILRIILPKDNEKDLPDLPENIRSLLEIHLVENMDEVLELALERPLTSLAPPVEPPVAHRDESEPLHQ